MIFLTQWPLHGKKVWENREGMILSRVLLLWEKLFVAESQMQWPIKMILAFSITLAHSLLLACNTAIVLSGHWSQLKHWNNLWM